MKKNIENLDPWYQIKCNYFKENNSSNIKGGTVFLGDSITDNYNVYEYFNNKLVYNRGINGDFTYGILNRLDVSVFDLNPTKVVLLIGTNDLSFFPNDTNEEIFQRIKLIIDAILNYNNNIKVYVQSIYPVSNTYKNSIAGIRTNENIKIINSLLEELKKITFLNTYNVLADNDSLNHDFTYDGLHLNGLGYKIVTKYLKNYII